MDTDVVEVARHKITANTQVAGPSPSVGSPEARAAWAAVEEIEGADNRRDETELADECDALNPSREAASTPTAWPSWRSSPPRRAAAIKVQVSNSPRRRCPPRRRRPRDARRGRGRRRAGRRRPTRATSGAGRLGRRRRDRPGARRHAPGPRPGPRRRRFGGRREFDAAMASLGVTRRWGVRVARPVVCGGGPWRWTCRAAHVVRQRAAAAIRFLPRFCRALVQWTQKPHENLFSPFADTPLLSMRAHDGFGGLRRALLCQFDIAVGAANLRYGKLARITTRSRHRQSRGSCEATRLTTSSCRDLLSQDTRHTSSDARVLLTRAHSRRRQLELSIPPPRGKMPAARVARPAPVALKPPGLQSPAGRSARRRARPPRRAPRGRRAPRRRAWPSPRPRPSRPKRRRPRRRARGPRTRVPTARG